MNFKRSKYGNKKIIVNGIKFDSKKEAAYYLKLKLMESSNAITELKLQVVFRFEFENKTLFKYIADFTYCDAQGRRHVVDVKGFRTPIYRLKKKLVEAFHKIKIEEV